MTLIVVHRRLRATAFSGWITIPTTFTGIHGAHQHKFCRISHRSADPGNGHHTVFQRLTHNIQCIFLKFRKLIQKQHTLMSHGNLTGARGGSSSRKTCRGDGVVRAAERTLLDQRASSGQKPQNGIHLGCLQGFLPCHIRQDRRQTFAQHTLAGAGRSYQQDIMPAGGCNFHCALHIFLPLYVSKVQAHTGQGVGRPQGFRRNGSLAAEMCRKLGNGLHRNYCRSPGQCGLRRVLRRNIECFNICVLGGQSHGEDARYGAHLALQTQFTQECLIRTRLSYKTHGCQYAQQNRKVI